MLLPRGRILLLVGDIAATGLKPRSLWGSCVAPPARSPHPRTRGPARCSGSVHGQRARRIVGDRHCRDYRPAERTLRYCLAGHPPLLLRDPDGTLTLLGEARGPLLGFEARGHPERVVTFVPGSFLVLFTDGLVERRGEIIDTGLTRLGTALMAAAKLDPVNLCKALIEQSLPRTGRNDDTAILCAFLARHFMPLSWAGRVGVPSR